jgi:hypothetical protein
MTKDKIRAAIGVVIDAESDAWRARFELMQLFYDSLDFEEMEKHRIVLHKTKNRVDDLLKLLEFYGGAK